MTPGGCSDAVEPMGAVLDKPVEKVTMRAPIPGFQRQYIHHNRGFRYSIFDLRNGLFLLLLLLFEQALYGILFVIGHRTDDGDGAHL